MVTLTIRLPDEKHERLRQLAERRNVSMNKLISGFGTSLQGEVLRRHGGGPG